MKRSRAFRPFPPDSLEGRVVLSQVYFSPQTGIIDSGMASHAQVAHPQKSVGTHEITQTKLADGKLRTSDISVVADDGETLTSATVHEADGTTKTISRTATTSGGTTTFTQTTTLPDGGQQTETGTEVSRGSTATILPNGTVQANPDSATIRSVSSTFDHVITQTGRGIETIQGTTVTQTIKGRNITVTDEQVTHFDGTQDQVKFVAIKQDGVTTTHKTMTAPDGATTTTVSTSKTLSSKTT